MLDFLLKLFAKPPKQRSPKVDPDTPCWRCLQKFSTGSLVQHKCQHGYNCVMLGWRCLKCRILTAMRRGVCYVWKCPGGECFHLKEVAGRLADGKEPFDGFDNITGTHEI